MLSSDEDVGEPGPELRCSFDVEDGDVPSLTSCSSTCTGEGGSPREERGGKRRGRKEKEKGEKGEKGEKRWSKVLGLFKMK